MAALNTCPPRENDAVERIRSQRFHQSTRISFLISVICEICGYNQIKGEFTLDLASSVPGLILAAVLHHDKSDALNHRTDGKWFNIPATKFVERVKSVALGLASLGVR